MAVIILLLLSTSLFAEELAGRVVGVTDGDTITILDAEKSQFKIRLAGIDAPEKKQPFGQASRKSLSDLIYDRTVIVDWKKQDQYGRIVGKILLDGKDINLEQINLGMAWFYRKYQDELQSSDRLNYLHAEENAQNSAVGIWSEKNPTPPWDFRKSRRNQ